MNLVEEFVENALIIDDKSDEIEGLKEALEKQGIWVTHYLPDDMLKADSIKHHCLIFLDLHLSETEDNITSILSIYTRPILKKHFSNNRAYGIVIWSLHDEEISVFHEKIIEDTARNKIYTQPTFIVALDKIEYIKTQDYSRICDDLNAVLLKSPAASFFMSWSISVVKGISHAITDFFSLSPDFLDKENKILRNLYLLAKNYTGIPEDILTDYSLYQDAYKAFDELLYSSLCFQQKEILVDIFENYEYSKNSNFKEELLNFANFNERMFIEHTSESDQDYIFPGSVYEIINDNEYLNLQGKPRISKTIAIELTPPCDFSHKKINSKLVGGFIFDLPDDEEQINKYANKVFRADSKYLVWPLLIGGDKPKMICFDFRYISVVHDSDLKNKKKYKLMFRAKHSLFADIIQKYSSHSARIGVASMKPEI
jgi:hypothetical protein